MISSMNAFLGLSASDVLKLFAANGASATPSSVTSATTGPASTDDAASSAADPASAIRTILAEAQINHSPTVTLGGADSGAQYYSGTVGVAYGATRTAATSTADPVQITQAYMSASQDDSSVTATSGTGVTIGELNGLDDLTSLSFSSVAANSDLGADDAASAANLQETIALGDDSLTVGFSLQGLGPLVLQNNELTASSGQGQLQDFFQIDVSVTNQTFGMAFNVDGLDSTQAQALGAAFEQATSAPTHAEVSSTGPANQYAEDFGAGFSATFVDILGY